MNIPIKRKNGLLFFIAALFETRISDVEAGVRTETAAYRVSGFFADTREGLLYLWNEKGLLLITAGFALCSLGWGASSVLTLPWFRENQPDGELVYMSVWGFMVIGRVLGGMIQYRWRLPAAKKYAIALVCCVSGLFAEGFYLFALVHVMQLLCFLIGIFNGCSYNIRVSATQSYVDMKRQGRFNGTMLMLATVGTLSGELLAGIAVAALPMREALAVMMSVTAVVVLVLLTAGRRQVQPVYNRET